jgi:hypothetical protein
VGDFFFLRKLGLDLVNFGPMTDKFDAGRIKE